MDFLHAEIGSAKDNLSSPVHNWYKFTAGFSYRFVDEIIALEGLGQSEESLIFDPFAGCGTTLVSSQKKGVNAIGNESQSFMFEIIKAKLNWNLTERNYKKYRLLIENNLSNRLSTFNVKDVAHPLLVSLYTKETLKTIYLIKDIINQVKDSKYKRFFKLALSQTLHKVSLHPIAIPYIVRTKTLSNTDSASEVFLSICDRMFNDTVDLPKKITSKVYRHDSRRRNKKICDNSCDVCITSPPYLNNLDYGEVSKVHTHLFEITENWNDITNKVRKKLVTGATTHYSESEFSLQQFKKTSFYNYNINLMADLLNISENIKAIAKDRSGKKSFHILMLYYFRDMFEVLLEIKRVLHSGAKAYLILGDSAPYGVYINTTEILGKIGLNCGFESFDIHQIRSRGGKWKSLTHRHSIQLTENVLVLK